MNLLPNSIYGIITNFYGEIVYEIYKQDLNNEFNNYLKYLLQVIDELRLNTHESKYGLIGIGLGIYGIVSKTK